MKSAKHLFSTRRNRIVGLGLLGAIGLIALFLFDHAATAQTVPPTNVPLNEIEYLSTEVAAHGTVSIVVVVKAPELDALDAVTLQPGNNALLQQRVQEQERLANAARDRLLQTMTGLHFTVDIGKDFIAPIIGMVVDQATLNFLKASPLVAGISVDHVMKNADTRTTAQTGTDFLYNHAQSSGGYSGSLPGDGQIIVDIDSGASATHPYFQVSDSNTQSRIIRIFESCFSGNQGVNPGNGVFVTPLCPASCNNLYNCIGTDTGAPCNLAGTGGNAGCEHGTQVAGVAIGWSSNPTIGNGTARGALLVPVQATSNCGNNGCYFDKDVEAALNWVRTGLTTATSFHKFLRRGLSPSGDRGMRRLTVRYWCLVEGRGTLVVCPKR